MQGIEKDIVWDIEKQGSRRPFRIMQKRGVIVDSDDYLPVTSTYPEHPLTKNKPNATSQSELKLKRALNNRNEIESKIQKFEMHKQRVKT